MTHKFNSQFECIGFYTKETHKEVRQNIVNELVTFKEEYVDLLNGKETFDEYIQNISKLDTRGDNITLIAASQYYKLNISINDKTHITIGDHDIDLFLKTIDDEYFLDKPSITTLGNIKYILNSEWSLWSSTKIKSQNWLDTIKNIINVGSIGEFWSVFNNIPEAGNLNFPFDYYFFRNGILPMWEFPENKNGGKMTITFKKTCDLDYFNNTWLNSVLACIGEQFEDSHKVCGAVLNIRKHQDRINLWLNTDNEEDIRKIGLEWKEILDLPKIHISYIKHDNSDIQYII